LVRIGHHGYEHVEQHNNVDDGVGAKHEQRPEAGEALDTRQLESHQVHETESRPEQRLRRLEQTGK